MKRLETERLILKGVEIEDREAIFYNIYHDKEVQKTFLARYVEKLEDFSIKPLLEHFEKHHTYHWSITVKESNTCIGMIFENERKEEEKLIEIGYAIGTPYWNKGYVSEAFKAVISHIQKEGWYTISASAFKENKASIQVMKKCGLVYSHTVENELEWHGEWHNVDYYMKDLRKD